MEAVSGIYLKKNLCFQTSCLECIYLTFLVPFQFKFVIFYIEMCILEHLIDVENFTAICKNSRVISLTKKDCFMYIFDGHHYDSSTFKVLCNIEVFFSCDGPIDEK